MQAINDTAIIIKRSIAQNDITLSNFLAKAKLIV